MSQILKFLISESAGKKSINNKSCYFKKDGIMILINCGKGVAAALKKSKVLKDVKEVFQVLTHDSIDHLHDIKPVFDYIKAETGSLPKLIESISYKKEKLNRLGIKEGKDFISIEPLKNNFNWINFLAVPHSDKSLSCPIELYLDNKKIFYAGDCGNIPFSIENYDEYYIDFADKESEYFMYPEKVKKLAKKNKIRKDRLWVVHLMNARALKIAQMAGMQVAAEEKKKFKTLAKMSKKVTKEVPKNQKQI